MRLKEIIICFILSSSFLFGQGFDRQIPNKTIQGRINFIKGTDDPKDSILLGVYFNPPDYSSNRHSGSYQTFGYYYPNQNLWKESATSKGSGALLDLIPKSNGAFFCMSDIVHSAVYYPYRNYFFKLYPGDDTREIIADSLSYLRVLTQCFHRWNGRYFVLVNDSVGPKNGTPVRQFNLVEIDTLDFSKTKLGEYEYPPSFPIRGYIQLFLLEDSTGFKVLTGDSVIYYKFNQRLPHYTVSDSIYTLSGGVQYEGKFTYHKIDTAGLSIYTRDKDYSGLYRLSPKQRYNFKTGFNEVNYYYPSGIESNLFMSNPFNSVMSGHYDADSNITAICNSGDETHVYKLNPNGDLIFHHRIKMYANVVHSFTDGSYYLGGHYAYPRKYDPWSNIYPRLIFVDKYGRTQSVFGNNPFQVHYQSATNQLKLFFEPHLSQVSYQITDASGRIMQQGELNTYDLLSLGNWRSGIYHLQLWSSDGAIVGTQAFLKN